MGERVMCHHYLEDERAVEELLEEAEEDEGDERAEQEPPEAPADD
jgi:hypothetical protein